MKWLHFKYFLLLLFSVAIAIVGIFLQISYSDDYQELGMSIQQLIELRGFTSETHFIQSKQKGYLLQAVRIVNPLIPQSAKSRLKPVILHHGYQCSGSMWVIAAKGRLLANGTYWEDDVHSADPNTPGNTLGFVLATSGYDVWLANARGNLYSTNHTSLNVDDEAFWNFSADEIIQFDMPALVDYILDRTGHSKVGYIAHSQGNLLLYGLLASQPKYNSLIQPAIGLSPVAYFVEFNVYPIKLVESFRDWLPVFWPKNILSGTLRWWWVPHWCAIPFVSQSICYAFYYALLGSPKDQVNMKRLPIYIDNAMHGSSTKNFVHLLQHRTSLVYYNYGDAATNMQHYNRTYPPHYNYAKITSKSLALIYAANDWFLHPADIERFKDSLKVPIAEEYQVPDRRWSHMELVWGKDVGKVVNKKILEILKKY